MSHLLPGGRRVTPSQPTIAPPPPINMVLCATPYRVPDEEKKESEGRGKEGETGMKKRVREREREKVRESE